MNHSIAELRREVAREIAMRKTVYRRALQQGRQRPAELNRLIECMQAIDEILAFTEYMNKHPQTQKVAAAKLLYCAEFGVPVPDFDIETDGAAQGPLT